MSIDGLKKQKVGPLPAHIFVYGIPAVVFLLVMVIGLSMKPNAMSDVDPADASKRVVSVPKSIFFSFVAALVVGSFTYVIATKAPDQL